MKLSKRQLQKIIKEEKAKLLKEARNGGWDGSYGGSHVEGMDVMQLVADEMEELGVQASSEFWSRLNSYINDVEKAAAGKGEDPQWNY